jgi:D-alanine-D-alanine ligase
VKRTRVAVLTGGFSPEWRISLLTGQTILKNLNENEFEALELRILKDGWKVIVGEESFEVDKRDFSWRDHEGIKRHFDLAFMAIHGHPGEDGVLQGYLETIGIPLAGSGVFASSLSFNKAQSSAYAAKFDVSVAPSILLRVGEPIPEKEVKAILGFPVFVKPNRSGSSFGISRVANSSELEAAISIAFEHDELIIIEKGITGIELACGLSDHNEDVDVLGITEIVPKNVFFDYESKYSGESQEITPARIDAKTKDLVEQQSILLYKQFELKGIARIDYILDSNGTPWMIEINSVPGMSSESIIPKQLIHKGYQLSDIFGKIARQCLPKK